MLGSSISSFQKYLNTRIRCECIHPQLRKEFQKRQLRIREKVAQMQKAPLGRIRFIDFPEKSGKIIPSPKTNKSPQEKGPFQKEMSSSNY